LHPGGKTGEKNLPGKKGGEGGNIERSKKKAADRISGGKKGGVVWGTIWRGEKKRGGGKRPSSILWEREKNGSPVLAWGEGGAFAKEVCIILAYHGEKRGGMTVAHQWSKKQNSHYKGRREGKKEKERGNLLKGERRVIARLPKKGKKGGRC